MRVEHSQLSAPRQFVNAIRWLNVAATAAVKSQYPDHDLIIMYDIVAKH